MAGRKPGYRTPEEVRDKIRASVLITRLTKHVESPNPLLDASQVNAAKVLLNKVLPDVKSVEFQGTMEHDVGDGLKKLMNKIDGRTRTK